MHMYSMHAYLALPTYNWCSTSLIYIKLMIFAYPGLNSNGNNERKLFLSWPWEASLEQEFGAYLKTKKTIAKHWFSITEKVFSSNSMPYQWSSSAFLSVSFSLAGSKRLTQTVSRQDLLHLLINRKWLFVCLSLYGMFKKKETQLMDPFFGL